MNEDRNALIVVLGMHRSGTSAIARSLQVLGVELGGKLRPPVPGNNAKGFWEDLDINTINIEMLDSLGSDWHYLAPILPGDVDQLRQKGYLARAIQVIQAKTAIPGPFGFKDPRTAKLLPFWKEVFRHVDIPVQYVIAVRHPLSVAKSLEKRDGFPLEKGYLLWLEHTLSILTGTAGEKRILVDYDRLMRWPDAELARLAKALGLRVDRTRLEEYKTEFLDKDLQHTIFKVSDLKSDKAIPPLVAEIHPELVKAASDKEQVDSAAFEKKLGLWNAEFVRQRAALVVSDKLAAQIMPLNAETAALAERDRQITSLTAALKQWEELWMSVQSGMTYKLVERIRSSYFKIAPEGSRRDKLVRLPVRALLVARREGFPVLLGKISHKISGAEAVPAAGKRSPGSFRSMPRQSPELREKAREIEKTGLFDHEWYLQDNPEIRRARVNPVEHYLAVGIQNSKNPSPLFNTGIYTKFMDGLVAPEDALLHFYESGRLFAPGAYRTADVLIAAQQRYYRQLDMECLVDRRAQPARYAVYLQCGAGSVHEKWLGQGARSWHLLVDHYDRTHEGKIPCDMEFRQSGTQPGTKFTSFHDLLRKWPHALDDYAYVLLLDDDILIKQEDIDRLFEIASDNRLDLAQASLSEDSHCAHPIFKNSPKDKIRRLNAVEIMMPILSRDAIRRGGYLFGQAVSGWGLDEVLGKLCEAHGGAAVIDEVVASHTKSINTDQGAFYDMLHRAYIYPEIELTHLQRIYHVGRSFYALS